ncbi:hypothetical protein C7974DRAFT_398889 [Boeremia exigua]|uniref:uncharacterized protein n=1 Tax=Boeremia exigua TaxID=749465 RepID=UPI001E8D79C9|nr:uncharacterized protein C7974DRAFT_398889 [Boeremia exigua]KAH6620094.1 hypothetical protein C7974DRAFT_398889 [Boeremia exigua]
MRALVRLVTALACSTAVAAAQCYFPNGNAVDSDTACNPNALVSACCYDNQACLSNGLCVSDPHDPVKARLHRGTCTDENWKSGNCPRQCLDIDNNGVPVYSCNSTTTDSYCCYDGCDCSAGSASEVFTFAQSPADVYTLTIIGESFTQTRTSTASSSTSTTSASSGASSAPSSAPASASASPSTSSPATAATTTTTPAPLEPAASKPNTTALGVGLGVGIPAAAALAAGIFFLLRRRRNRNPYAPPSELAADEYALDPAPSTKYGHMAEAEVPPESPPAMHELGGQMNEKPVELPAPVPEPVELESPRSPGGRGRVG